MELLNLNFNNNLNDQIYKINYEDINIIECVKSSYIKLLDNNFNKLNFEEITVKDLIKNTPMLYIEYYNTKLDFTFYNNYFCHIYLINLDKRKDRLLDMLSLYNKFNLNFEIVKAIDGNEEPYISDFYSKTKNINPGEYGYLLTVKNILLDAKNRNYKKILILDDDIILSKYFYKFEYFSKFIDKDWEFLYLGCSQHNWIENINYKYSNYKFYYHPLKTSGSFSLGIDNKIFDELIINIENYDSPFDAKPIQNIISKNYKKSYVIYPNLFIADVSNSDIRQPRNIENFAKKVRWNLSDYYFKIPKKQVLLIYFLVDNPNLLKSLYSIQKQTYTHFSIIIYYNKLDENIKEIIISIFQHIKIIFCNKNKFSIIDLFQKNRSYDIITFLKSGISISDTRFMSQVLPFYKNNNILATKCLSDNLLLYEYFYSYDYLNKLSYQCRFNNFNNFNFFKYLNTNLIIKIDENLFE